MKVSIDKTGDNIIASIEGSIDSKTAPDLQQSLLTVISDNSTKVVLDLTKTTFVSSAGLRVLLMVYRQLKANDGKVMLVGVSEEIMDVMYMTGFNAFFEVKSTVEEALSN